MTSFLDQIASLPPKRLALLAAELKERLDAAQATARVPIAIVGMGCRLPGGPNPEAFWQLLREGRDAIADVPASRWSNDEYFDPDPDARGAIASRRAALLEDVEGFEPEFFRIAPREAASMDPQHRLVLEVAWEALEHAAIAPSSLNGSATGVFLGISGHDYQLRLLSHGAASIDAYLASGNAQSVASGRLAYVLGLQGPALSIDTACSASLVAIHAACRSLRDRECHLAIAGGVNVICAPEGSVAASRAHLLAGDGRCKTFDARGDGYVRGEGCGLLVLKRLSEAQRDGDRILAVIAGSAVNQDGRSSGLTAPNGPAQEAVLRAALTAAGLSPRDIDYVEAHGTGTSLGDPIEAQALARVLGEGRAADRPLLIGSVKTNVGHLESAAGVAGVIKMILALQHEQLPPHLNFEQPNPFIDWAHVPLEVLTQNRSWPRGSQPRRAGVSSFGFSGTNAHLVLEEAPPAPPSVSAPGRTVHVVPLSARTDDALRTLARAYGHALADDAVSLADAAHTAGVGRAHLVVRAAVVATDRAEASRCLLDLAAGVSHPGVRRSTAPSRPATDVVFLFTGAGAQYPGMGRQLYESSPVYRDVIDRCDAALGADEHGRRLTTVLANDDVHDMRWTQPALFALELGLTAVWRSWGITPAAVAGHSAGEYAAACAAGVFSLEDGVRFIAERGRLLASLPPGGAMATLTAPTRVVETLIAPFGARVAVAAYNAAESVVVSGDERAIDEVVAAATARGIDTQRLLVPLAAHSPAVAPALEPLRACAARIAMRAPAIPVIWNVHPTALLEGSAPDADYWCRHMREPVRFADDVAHLFERGHRVFLEVGPHSTLLALAQSGAPADASLFLPSLRRGHDDWHQLMTSVADLYANGFDIDWPAVDRPAARQRIALPTYPFERRRFWVDPAKESITSSSRPRGFALHGQRLSTPSVIVETVLAPDNPAWLGDHRVHDSVIVPAPVMLEMAMAAAKQAGTENRAFADVRMLEALAVPDEGRVVQVHLDTEGSRAWPVRIYSRPVRAQDWTLHATAVIVSGSASPAATADTIAAAADCDFHPLGRHYERMAASGLRFGPAFRVMTHAAIGAGTACVRLALPAALEKDPVAWAHPVLMDGALQAIGLALPPNVARDEAAYLVTEIGVVAIDAPLPPACVASARVAPDPRPDVEAIRADLSIHSLDGARLGSITGIVLRAARALATPTRHVFRTDWQTARLDSASSDASRSGRCLIVADDSALGADLAAACERAGRAATWFSASALDVLSGDELVATLTTGRTGPIAWLIDAALGTAAGPGSLEEPPVLAERRYIRHLALAQALDRIDPAAGLCLLTRGAQAVAAGENPSLADATAVGLSRTIGAERVGPCLRVDLDPASPVDGSLVLAALQELEPELALRGGRSFAPRLVPVRLDESATSVVRGDGAYLVTGASGALGGFVSAWLAGQGAAELVLLSRRPLAAETLDRVRSAGRPDLRIRLVAADVGDSAAIDSLAQELARSATPVRGIVHTAGSLADAPLHEQTRERYAAVARAKVEGSWLLHRAFSDRPLDFFVLFSSASAMFGTPGQGNYAAANAFEDAVARHRRAAGLPSTTIAWGPWDDGTGMGGSADDETRRGWQRRGVELMPVRDALEALAASLHRPEPYLLVGALNPSHVAAHGSRSVQRLLGGRPAVGAPAGSSNSVGADNLADALRTTTPSTEARAALVRRVVRQHAARALGLADSAIDDAVPLAAFGLDSLMAIQLRNSLQAVAGVSLPVSQLLRRPSVEHLSEVLLAELAAHEPTAELVPTEPTLDWEEGSL